MDDMQLFYDLLTDNICSYRSAKWIEKLHGLHVAPGRHLAVLTAMLTGPPTSRNADCFSATRHQPAVTSTSTFQHVWMEMKLSGGSAGKLAAVCKVNESRLLSCCLPFTSATHNLPPSLCAAQHHLSAATQLSSPGHCSTQRTSSPSPPQTKTSTLLNLFVPAGRFHPRRLLAASGCAVRRCAVRRTLRGTRSRLQLQVVCER